MPSKLLCTQAFPFTALIMPNCPSYIIYSGTFYTNMCDNIPAVDTMKNNTLKVFDALFCLPLNISGDILFTLCSILILQ